MHGANGVKEKQTEYFMKQKLRLEAECCGCPSEDDDCRSIMTMKYKRFA